MSMIYPQQLKKHKRKRNVLKIVPIFVIVGVASIVVFLLRDIKPNSYSNLPTNSIGKVIAKSTTKSVVSFARLQAEQMSEQEILNNPVILNQINNQNSMNSNTNTVITSPISTFKSEPDYSLDFSTIPSGTLVSSMFRIQNGANDDWDPSWNNEKQMYSPKNVLIKDGNLVMYANVESNGQITSGKVDTNGYFSATYGKFEVVAKLPKGIGTFPAIWLLPAEGSYFRDNVATASEKSNGLSWQGGGEIDVAEYLGIYPDSVFHTVHTYNSLVNSSRESSSETVLYGVSNDYHTYGIEWTPNYIAFTVDGIRTHVLNKNSSDFRDWPFDRPFYFIFNLAMGGVWSDQAVADAGLSFPNGIDNSSQNDWTFLIKSIKHYQLSQ